ncbi:hypothetical protein Q2T40_17540 [Winogradskyella maritima]|uniref:Tetratricopeptide repeat protein n=1 Tax=Winogradskyella maritima TaxID=1517766 RepID=A0ABV8AHU2_9FLAO|nr:hypothetical protein [Winogradskyella maritima]
MLNKRILLFVLIVALLGNFGFAQTEAQKLSAQKRELERRALAEELQIADGYFNKGEFEKARLSYEALYDKQPYNYNYLYKLVGALQQLEQYEVAQQLLKTRMERSKVPALLIELGYNYQLMDSLSLATPLYDEAIAFLDEKPNYVYSVGQKFEQRSLTDQAITTYEKAKTLLPDKNFSVQLARLYGDQGDVEAMFSNYLDYIAYRPDFINNTKRAISAFISENKENESNIMLRRLLLKRLQLEPNPQWNELLSWLYVQEKAYGKSFTQEKAIYRRNPESLNRIIELALTAIDDNDTDTANTIFEFILDTSQDLATQLTAHQYILDIKSKSAVTPKEKEAIKSEYLELFETYGRTETSLSLQLAYAHFLAFDLRLPKEASDFLKESASIDKSPFQEGMVKMKLADILVLQERFNEALIYYSQIQANLKNSTLAQEARFKIAKTSYYKGDFDWAETQLKILKRATSQLIANDALDLKLLISDNKYEDSTRTALGYYAKADLLEFQNRDEESLQLLGKILEEHKGESITDQTLFKQAQLFEAKKDYAKAEANYQKIIADWREDILIDDAYYFLAELYNTHLAQPEKAKELYEKILFNHEDSIYFVEARKKYRMLRGDAIN